MPEIVGDAMLLEKVHYTVKIVIDRYTIRGKLTLFKGEKLISDLNHEKNFIELKNCEIYNETGELIEKDKDVIVNKNYIALLQVEDAQS